MNQNRAVIRRRYAEAALTGLMSQPDMMRMPPEAVATLMFAVADAAVAHEDGLFESEAQDA